MTMEERLYRKLIDDYNNIQGKTKRKLDLYFEILRLEDELRAKKKKMETLS